MASKRKPQVKWKPQPISRVQGVELITTNDVVKLPSQKSSTYDQYIKMVNKRMVSSYKKSKAMPVSYVDNFLAVKFGVKNVYGFVNDFDFFTITRGRYKAIILMYKPLGKLTSYIMKEDRSYESEREVWEEQDENWIV